MTAQTADRNRSQEPSSTTSGRPKAGPVFSFVLASVFGLGGLVSGLFTLIALVAPFLPMSLEEYPKSVPPPPGAELSLIHFIGPAVLLVIFGPITVVLFRAAYANVRAAVGKSPIQVITPGIGWVIAIVFGGGTVFACVFGAIEGQWGDVARAFGALPLFLSAPFLAKSFRLRVDGRSRTGEEEPDGSSR